MTTAGTHQPRRVIWGSPRRRRAVLGAISLGLSMAAGAQEIEPRAYVNVPVGVNFLVAGYAHSTGGLSTDPSLPIADAHLKIDTGVLGYARSLDLWGRSGRLDVVVPYSELSGTARVAGQPATRDVSGFGDPRLRLSMNFYGAPALSLPEFVSYRQDLVIGASMQVTAPGPQYDPAKAINLGTNRWSVKPDVGLSKAFGALLVDLTAGVTVFTANGDFFGGQKLEQAPIYSMQGNVSYTFSGGIWASLGATYYTGGRTTVNGVQKDNALNNSRTGLTVSMPVDRNHSIKLNAASGISTRTGTDVKAVSVAWQYRWGRGL